MDYQLLYCRVGDVSVKLLIPLSSQYGTLHLINAYQRVEEGEGAHMCVGVCVCVCVCVWGGCLSRFANHIGHFNQMV